MKLIIIILFNVGILIHSYAQNDTILILGKVVDAKNNPVENANIFNLSSKSGIISNSNAMSFS